MWKTQMDMKLELIWWLIMVNGYTCWNIMNDMDYEYNDGCENDYSIHKWSWKYYDDDLYLMNGI